MPRLRRRQPESSASPGDGPPDPLVPREAERARLERLERSLRVELERERERAAAEVEDLKRALRERLDAVSRHASAPAAGVEELEQMKRALRSRSEAVSARE